MSRFPAGFRWGAASAAYQIEGAVTEDGRGPSIWDTFSHTPGTVLGGDTGDVACDHYHRSDADVALMADIGLDAYRFSIAWPRILPSGAGEVNTAGMDFYSRLVDRLLEHGIAPFVTLYHWDLPQPLQDAGGWTTRDTAARFADFAAVVAERLGDRVEAITTLNEPWCSAFLGHASGEHAPGITDDATALKAAHYLLLAHGLGVAAIRANVPSTTGVSITLNPHVFRPVSDQSEDVAAAQLADMLTNQLFVHPLRHGRYPDGLVAATAGVTDWSFVTEADLATMAAPIDFLGVNYYQPTPVSASPPASSPNADVQRWPGAPSVYVHPNPLPHTGMGWGVDPNGLVELLHRLHDDLPGVPMMITENGAAYPDVMTSDGQIEDTERTAYLLAHIDAVHRAIEEGIDVRGYFAWTLLDNFEWAWGYSQRFGIVGVDYATQTRTPKRSARSYSKLITEERSASRG